MEKLALLDSQKGQLSARFAVAVALLVPVLLAGCASVSFDVQNNRFLTPENNGETFAGKLGVGYGSKSRVVLVDSADLETGVIDDPKVQADDGFTALLEMSAVPKLDFFYGPSGLGAKVQVLGQPASLAKQGDLSLAFALGGDWGKTEKKDSYDLSGNSYEEVGEAVYRIIDYMSIVGYRLEKDSLLYANFGFTTFSASGSITKKTSSNGTETSHTETTIPEGSGRQISLLIGYEISGEHFFGIVEPGFVQTRWDGADTLGRGVFGLAGGIKW